MLKFSLLSELSRRILVLDGGLGTMVQAYGLGEQDYRGDMFRDWPVPLKGCNETLALTRPDVLTEIHEAYLQAGADIISTDSFNANALSLSDQMLDFYVYDICRAAASLARAAADRFTLSNPSKPRFVAGSVGPGNRSASISPDVNRPGARAVTFDELKQAYYDQVRGLVDGGADLILIETFFDTLNAKAAIFAVGELSRERKTRIPVMVSGTLTDVSGRTLSGQTVEAFYTSVHHGDVISVGLNCGLGAEKMRPYIERLAAVAACAVSAHPNAGLPDKEGHYDETPEMMAETVEQYLSAGLLNIVGGCCGTTPVHIAAIAAVAARTTPRTIPEPDGSLLLSGLEPLRIASGPEPLTVGLQADATVSPEFAVAIRDKRYETAANAMRAAIETGSPLAAVCVDDAMGAGPAAIRDLLNIAMATPETARVPVAILSSDWKTLEAGMQCVQGKPLIGPLSLADGDEEFVRRVSLAARYGAAVLVALADEEGDARSYRRKTAVAARVAGWLERTGFPSCDVAVDPGVCPVSASGIGEEDASGMPSDFFDACRGIRQQYPQWKLCGRIGVVSDRYRPDPGVCRALNGVWLSRAAEAGLDLAFADEDALRSVEEIPEELLGLCEKAIAGSDAASVAALTDYVLGHNPEAERLRSLFRDLKDRTAVTVPGEGFGQDGGTETGGAGDGIGYAKETATGLTPLWLEPLASLGELYRAGTIPFALLERGISVVTGALPDGVAACSGGWGRVLMATVGDDGYDPGRAALKTLLLVSGCRVEDMGLVREPRRIIERCLNLPETGAAMTGKTAGSTDKSPETTVPGVVGDTNRFDAVLLRGVSARGVGQIAFLLAVAQKQGLQIPFLVGEPAASALQTAVGLAPQYGAGAVLYGGEPVATWRALRRIASPEKDMFLIDVQMEQMALREEYADRAKNKPFRTLSEARAHALKPDFGTVRLPAKTGREVFADYDLKRLVPLINWSYFFGLAGLPGRYPDLLDDPVKGVQARQLYDDARQLLDEVTESGVLHARGIVALYPARRDGDDIVLYEDTACTRELHRLPQLRNQQTSQAVNLSLADFVAPVDGDAPDCVGLYALTLGDGLATWITRCWEEGSESRAKLAELLAGRLCEAFAEELHRYARIHLWGIEQEGQLSTEELLAGDYPGIRPAFGIPSCPDRSYRETVFRLLGVPAAIGMRLNENFDMEPAPAACGLIFASAEARNFSVGQIDAEQLETYARRRNMPVELLRKLIRQYIQS